MKRQTIILLVVTLILSMASVGVHASQKLVIANIGDVVKLDSAFVTDVQSASVANQIFERLAKFDKNGVPEPALATSWETSEDGLVWTFFLREGVTFHDGTPFNAAAVKYTFDRMKDPALASPGAGDVKIVENIVALDDFTVQFHLERPSAAFISTSIMSTRSGIVSPAAAEKFGEDFSFNPVGTGPFKFVEWEPDSHVTLAKNAKYWAGAPLLDEVVFRPIPEAATQMIELETGGIDLAFRVGPNDVGRIESNPNLQLFSTPDYNARYIFFQTQKAPTDNILVRHAISHAIPVDLILEAFLSNIAVQIDGVMPDVSWAAFAPDTKFEYDLDKAKALLTQAGYTEKNNQGYLVKDGQEFFLEIYSPDGRYPMDKEIAAVIQQSLQDIGIRSEIKVLEWGAYLAAVDAGEHQLCILGWSQSTGEPANMYGTQFKSHAIGGWANAMFYNNPKVDELLIQGEIESDMEKRAVIYKEIQEIIASDAPMIPLYSELLMYAAQSYVKGYNHSPSGFDLTTVYIDK